MAINEIYQNKKQIESETRELDQLQKTNSFLTSQLIVICLYIYVNSAGRQNAVEIVGR